MFVGDTATPCQVLHLFFFFAGRSFLNVSIQLTLTLHLAELLGEILSFSVSFFVSVFLFILLNLFISRTMCRLEGSFLFAVVDSNSYRMVSSFRNVWNSFTFLIDINQVFPVFLQRFAFFLGNVEDLRL